MNIIETQKISGWCSKQKQQALNAIVMATRPSISLEIGVWCGKSCIPIALAHKELNLGHVIAVDPWMGTASAEGQLHPADAEWWSDQSKHEWAYQQFCTHLYGFNVTKFVEVRRVSSSLCGAPDGIGLFHCDGNHGERAMQDVMANCPKVKLGGFVVLDDLNWTGGAVSRSVDWVEQNGFQRLYVVDDKETGNQWGVWQRIK